MDKLTAYDASAERFFSVARRLALKNACQRFRFRGSVYDTNSMEKVIMADKRYVGTVGSLKGEMVWAEGAKLVVGDKTYVEEKAEAATPAAPDPAPTAKCDPVMERRLRLVSIDQNDVFDWFAYAARRDWPHFIRLPDFDGLPPGSTLVSVHSNDLNRSFDFYVAHESFSPAARCAPVPTLQPVPVLSRKTVDLRPPPAARPVNREIVREVYKAMVFLGARSDLLSVVGSWGDSLTDAEVLHELRKGNEFAAVDLEERIGHAKGVVWTDGGCGPADRKAAG
jgi:hypothetical protein